MRGTSCVCCHVSQCLGHLTRAAVAELPRLPAEHTRLALECATLAAGTVASEQTESESRAVAIRATAKTNRHCIAMLLELK